MAQNFSQYFYSAALYPNIGQRFGREVSGSWCWPGACGFGPSSPSKHYCFPFQNPQWNWTLSPEVLRWVAFRGHNWVPTNGNGRSYKKLPMEGALPFPLSTPLPYEDMTSVPCPLEDMKKNATWNSHCPAPWCGNWEHSRIQQQEESLSCLRPSSGGRYGHTALVTSWPGACECNGDFSCRPCKRGFPLAGWAN